MNPNWSRIEFDSSKTKKQKVNEKSEKLDIRLRKYWGHKWCYSQSLSRNENWSRKRKLISLWLVIELNSSKLKDLLEKAILLEKYFLKNAKSIWMKCDRNWEISIKLRRIDRRNGQVKEIDMIESLKIYEEYLLK